MSFQSRLVPVSSLVGPMEFPAGAETRGASDANQGPLCHGGGWGMRGYADSKLRGEGCRCQSRKHRTGLRTLELPNVYIGLAARIHWQKWSLENFWLELRIADQASNDWQRCFFLGASRRVDGINQVNGSIMMKSPDECTGCCVLCGCQVATRSWLTWGPGWRIPSQHASKPWGCPWPSSTLTLPTCAWVAKGCGDDSIFL